jgi:predicted TIM-barrel fold metal-dependent hydrolase
LRLKGIFMQWIDGNTFFGSCPNRKLDVSPEDLVRLLKEGGVSRALTLSLVAPYLEAEEGNDLTRDASARHRELIPFGAVDPRRYTGGDAVRRLATLGAAAIRLTNRINNYPLDISVVEVVLAECAEADLTAFVDVVNWGHPTTLERLAEKHGCRIVMCGVHHSILSEAVVSMKRSGRLYLEISRLNTPDGVRTVARELGAGRVLFGSGAPFNYVSGARMVAERSELSPDELDRISSRTVLSLLAEEYRT